MRYTHAGWTLHLTASDRCRWSAATTAAVVMTKCEKSEDRLSENTEGVKEAKIVKERDTPDVVCIAGVFSDSPKNEVARII